MVKIKAKKAISTLQKIKGLIGETSIKPLVITTRFGIHTFGMKQAIDVIVLDKNQKVVKFRNNLKKNSVFVWNPIYNTVIELRGGYIKRAGIKTGDTIELSYTL